MCYKLKNHLLTSDTFEIILMKFKLLLNYKYRKHFYIENIKCINYSKGMQNCKIWLLAFYIDFNHSTVL